MHSAEFSFQLRQSNRICHSTWNTKEWTRSMKPQVLGHENSGSQGHWFQRWEANQVSASTASFLFSKLLGQKPKQGGNPKAKHSLYWGNGAENQAEQGVQSVQICVPERRQWLQHGLRILHRILIKCLPVYWSGVGVKVTAQDLERRHSQGEACWVLTADPLFPPDWNLGIHKALRREHRCFCFRSPWSRLIQVSLKAPTNPK